jgi:CspA family cold shock protein
MKTEGRVKYWNASRGFGFISRDDEHRDIFVHVRELPEGVHELTVGALVSFDEQPSRIPGKFEAKNVKVL